jgi:predicted CopG family antitoxin
MMTKRLTISITDELYDDLQMVKDKINVSQIASEALARQVEIEKMRLSPKDIDELVERIRLQHQKESQKWEKAGFECGLEEALSLDLEHFRTLENGGSPEDFGAPWWIKFREESRVPDEPPAINAFEKGFIKGCLSIWGQVKEEL